MDCDYCHQLSTDGKQMQLPNVTNCMVCHRSVMKASAAVQEMAQLDKAHQQIIWNRVTDCQISFSSAIKSLSVVLAGCTREGEDYKIRCALLRALDAVLIVGS
jgi:hypothetical protein